MWTDGKLDWRRVAAHGAGFLLVWLLLWALGWFSPGLGCFVSFVFTAGSIAWQGASGPVGEFRTAHLAAVAAAKAGMWVVAEARAREGLAAARRLRVNRTGSICVSAALLCMALNKQRRHTEAEATAREVLAAAGAAKNDAERVCLAMLWRSLAEELMNLDRTQEAEEAAARMEELTTQVGAAKVPGKDAFEAERLFLRVQFHRRRGEYREALELLGAVREALARVDASQVPVVALVRSSFYLETFRPDRALAALEELTGELEARRQLVVLQLRGWAMGDLGRWAEAEAVHREQLALRERWTAPEDVRFLHATIPLAISLVWQGKDASEYLARAERDAERMLSEERAELEYARGLALANAGRLAEAEQTLRESLALRERHTRADHPTTVDGLWALARVVELLGRTEESAGLRARVEGIRRAYADVA